MLVRPVVLLLYASTGEDRKRQVMTQRLIHRVKKRDLMLLNVNFLFKCLKNEIVAPIVLHRIDALFPCLLFLSAFQLHYYGLLLFFLAQSNK